jgi:OOP family OmpA-OmpF porin
LLWSAVFAMPVYAGGADPFADVPAASSSDDSGDVADAPSSIPGRPWYVSPMFTYTHMDKSRGLKDGLGGTVSVGKKVTDGMTLEFTGVYSRAKPDADTNGSQATLAGAGISAMVFPLNSVPDLFTIVSLMRGKTKDHPGPVPDFHETLFDIGLGYLFPISDNFLLRAEAKYRMDQHGHEAAGTTPDENPNFYDGVFDIGFLYRLGTEPGAKAETANVVDTASLDSDNDGVPDATDQCPGTPAGAVVNENGCEQDADGDGVPDRLDKCADSAPGMAVNADGCPLDTDGDGVPDDVDECPNSPAGAKVLQNGCALQGDCRKPHPGEQVDDKGCAVEQKFILKGVKFEFDSDRLTEDAKKILVEVAATLQAYPDIKVELQGHTDNIGTDAYNQGLSERRAIAVKTFLAGASVEADRMTPTGYGEAQPIDTNETEEGRENNRRVEMKVLE